MKVVRQHVLCGIKRAMTYKLLVGGVGRSERSSGPGSGIHITHWGGLGSGVGGRKEEMHLNDNRTSLTPSSHRLQTPAFANWAANSFVAPYSRWISALGSIISRSALKHPLIFEIGSFNRVMPGQEPSRPDTRGGKQLRNRMLSVWKTGSARAVQQLGVSTCIGRNGRGTFD